VRTAARCTFQPAFTGIPNVFFVFPKRSDREGAASWSRNSSNTLEILKNGFGEWPQKTPG